MKPDVVVVAKPVGGGLPLGAILAKAETANILEPGMHGTTFGGNPVACAAGIAVIQEIMNNGLMKQAEVMGNLLKTKLLDLKKEFPILITEVRGYGCMAGMELTQDGEPVVTALREKGILLNCTNQNVLRFLPPLIVQEDQIVKTTETLKIIFAGI